MENKKRGIAIAGTIVVDVLNNIREYPKPSMLAPILSSERAVGGCVPNTLIDLAKIDPTLKLDAYSMVGDDENGRFSIDWIRNGGVNVDHISIAPGVSSGVSYVMADMTTKERTFFCSLGANAVYDVDDDDRLPDVHLHIPVWRRNYTLLSNAYRR